ncbi:hypothetical protein [Bacillus sp. Marseille-Q3570]|uniref:hypothetical protein n=1 Tax=Bacillus sp. Marseille-Q3570 TaxID=2963522 RepID=UPI0021B84975|nr:hypothetical protein [Bacillus sp. Marseille-Q3570]
MQKKVQEAIKNAEHGEFFWAKWTTGDGFLRDSPCLVLSKHRDVHDEIIILKCTSQNAKSNFDVPVTIKNRTVYVRTNKIYTIQRDQLTNPLKGNFSPAGYTTVIEKVKEAQNIEQ